MSKRLFDKPLQAKRLQTFLLDRTLTLSQPVSVLYWHVIYRSLQGRAALKRAKVYNYTPNTTRTENVAFDVLAVPSIPTLLAPWYMLPSFYGEAYQHL